MIKPGDYVICINDSFSTKLTKGQIYYILEISKSQLDNYLLYKIIDLHTSISIGAYYDVRFIPATSEQVKVYENELEMMT